MVGPFAYHWLHHGAFLVLASLYLVAAVVCAALVPYVPPLPVSPMRRVFGAVFGPGPLRSFLPAWIACFALLGAYAAHLPALLRRAPVPGQTLVHHFDERLVSAMLVSWIALLLVGIALWTPRIPRVGAVRIMRLATPGAWLIAGALLAMNHTAITWTPLFLPLLAAGVLILAGFGPAAVTYLAECSETFVADRAALMAFYTVALAGGGALGSIVGGFAVRAGYLDGLVLFGFALSVFAFFALTPVVRYERAVARAVGRPVARRPGLRPAASGGPLRQWRGQRGHRTGALRVARQRPVVGVLAGCSRVGGPAGRRPANRAATMIEVDDDRREADVDLAAEAEVMEAGGELLLEQGVGAQPHAPGPAEDHRPEVQPLDVERHHQGGQGVDHPHAAGRLVVDDVGGRAAPGRTPGRRP